MKILVVSDYENPYIWDFFDREKFKDIDLVISCGDLKSSYLSFLVTMIPKPLLYVPGNHDIRYLDSPPEGCINIDNGIFVHNGIRIAGLGGSIEYSGGPFQYTEAHMKKRVKRLSKLCSKKGGIDILVTHAPSYGIGDGDDWAHKGFECFHSFYTLFNPKFHLHGHQHLNYNRGTRIHYIDQTTIINGYSYYIFDYPDK